MTRATAAFVLAMFFAPLSLHADHEWQRVDVEAESAHPYPDENSLESPRTDPVRLRIPGAQAYQIHFAAIDLEPNYDFLEIYSMSATGELTLVQRVTGSHHELLSKAIPGPEAWVVIHSDETSAGFGFVIDWVQIQVTPKGVPGRGPRDPGRDPGPPGRGPIGPGGTRPPHGHGVGEDPEGGVEIAYTPLLTRLEVGIGQGEQLEQLPESLDLEVGTQLRLAVRGLDQFGRPMEVVPQFRIEGFRGGLAVAPQAPGEWQLNAGHRLGIGRVRLGFPQNPAFDRSVAVRVHPAFAFRYRDDARKVHLTVYTGVRKEDVYNVNLYYTTDRANLLGGEDVTAIVVGKTGPEGTMLLKEDHAYPLQRGVGYFTMKLVKTDGTEILQTYSIEYKKANPQPLSE